MTLYQRLVDGLVWGATLTRSNRLSGWDTPSILMSALKNQWRECSELDCAMSNSSTVVGSLPPPPRHYTVTSARPTASRRPQASAAQSDDGFMNGDPAPPSPFHVVAEHVGVILEVPVIEAQPQLLRRQPLKGSQNPPQLVIMPMQRHLSGWQLALRPEPC